MVLFGFYKLTHRPFQTQAQQRLRFHSKFHRQFLEHFLAKTVDDHRHGVFRRQAALLTEKQLVFADFGGGGFVLDLRRRLFDFYVGKRMRAAPVAD